MPDPERQAGDVDWRAVAAGFPLATVRIALDGRVTFTNDWFCRLVERSADSVDNRDFAATFLPESLRDRARAVLAEPSEQGRRFDVAPLVTGSGQLRLVRWVTAPERDETGRVVAIVACGDDVTEQQEAARLLSTVNEITRALLEDRDADAILRLICRGARELVGADLATVATPLDDETLTIRVADGAHAAEVEGMTFTPEASVSGAVIASGEPLLLEDAALDSRIHQPIIAVGRIGPSLFVPLVARGRPFGTILAARVRGGRLFAERELRLLETFADQAAVTVEYGRAQRQQRQLSIVEERERIARDLHDTVIQQLFAIGMGLEALLRLLGPGDTAERAQRAVDGLDATIRDIRSTIFMLEAERHDSTGLRSRVRDVALEAARSLGFEPRVRFDGPVDSAVSDTTADHLVALVTEALSNVARHAGATEAEVFLAATAARVICRVTDNGCGLAERRGPSGLGLRNMGERARRIGGTLEISGRPGGGTRVELIAPREGSA